MTESAFKEAQKAWQIPAFTANVLEAKRSSFALVIPVINEGQRIRDQLTLISGLSLPIDVVIADGGSTDGSLDVDTLKKNYCRALLTKVGTGRLSAQLRIAYAWCLEEGYDGIVTVDGNGKDNVEAIPLFLSRLGEGYDMVQGSRYIAGGRAVNTPVDRWLASRLIHAPLISIAAGFHWTDTTNGFRAYSRTALLDPRIAPFRDIFVNYNLLFYLSVRIPQVGLRTVEVPVERRYPPHGKTPTKISGFRGRFAMMTELVRAAAGTFDPQPRTAD
jgi:glycosyltransferase involved in cell wall biosynthesis